MGNNVGGGVAFLSLLLFQIVVQLLEACYVLHSFIHIIRLSMFEPKVAKFSVVLFTTRPKHRPSVKLHLRRRHIKLPVTSGEQL